jgi:hypothetical protein
MQRSPSKKALRLAAREAFPELTREHDRAKRARHAALLAHRFKLDEAIKAKRKELVREAAPRRWSTGWSQERFNRYHDMQNGKCAICKVDFTASGRAPHADHDHATWIPRGLLCAGCNTGLGMFKESPEALAAAIKYLKEWHF